MFEKCFCFFEQEGVLYDFRVIKIWNHNKEEFGEILIELCKEEPAMKLNDNYYNYPTTSYNYNVNEREFVLCYKARPFAVLASPFFPTPSCSYIDHQLVMELGIKMSDISCKKICFAGKKLRLLGKVSFTAQCVKERGIFGNFHFKASVIENLQYHFDTHAIAGSKMTSLLNGNCSNPSSPSSSPPPSSSSTPSRAPSPPRSTTSRAAPSPPKARPLAAQKGRPSPNSPPGFPYQPLHPPPPDAPSHSHLNHPILFSNLIMLNQMFGGADNRDNVEDERRTLKNIDEEGTEDHDQPQFTYRKSDESQYQTGHGRTKYRYEVCSDSWEVPDNCSFSADMWQLPDKFRPCSQRCRGAFCPCINNYKCG